MEASGLNELNYDAEERALKGLLDAFGSVFSLNEIASAYCKAAQNADLAGEMLYDMQGSNSKSTTHASNLEAKGEESLKSSCNNISENSCQADGKLRAPKTKWHPVSGGTISSVLGKNYLKSTLPANSPRMTTKPLKLDSKVLPVSELWGEEGKLNPSRDDNVLKDMEDFLFKMLGDGFQLDRDMIREVLDNCGYDMPKSMEKLLDQSAVSLDKKSNKCLGESAEKFTGMCPISEGPSSQRKLQLLNSSREVPNTNGGELSRQQKERNDLQKEVLAALFNSPERYEELPRRTVKTARMPRRCMALGEVVVEPPTPRVFTTEYKVDVVTSQQDNNDDEEDGYQVLRRAVKEYRGTMKEYYKAAVDAFAKGDSVLAGKLLEQGHFFRDKAREADEESNQKIFETKNMETEDEMLLDLHEHAPRDARQLLKCHLSSLSGIPSIKYLKVIIDTNDKDDSKGARKRLIIKLLEKESIDWTEGNSGTILIRIDTINPKHLSFAKK